VENNPNGGWIDFTLRIFETRAPAPSRYFEISFAGEFVPRFRNTCATKTKLQIARSSRSMEIKRRGKSDLDEKKRYTEVSEAIYRFRPSAPSNPANENGLK